MAHHTNEGDENLSREYIVYACPLGPLADQIDGYYAASRARYGPNAAHQYMAHCTLTGFFHDTPRSAAGYVAALGSAHESGTRNDEGPALVVREMLLREDFHGLLLDATWLRDITGDFARRAGSHTRRDDIRIKDWLHLSLAYGFPPEQHAPLAALARECVEIRAAVQWELRFYERHAEGGWTCHASWPL